ncbi:putative XRE family transcriptional regulator (plasmid) [Calothrix sp. NIES-4071]|nr:putative XRE family transcriptional regulator [Calothrix sp. NIES-4071]BAZ64575.1 putative XRE family transcriptional regulator [Calothrix sp. NIES-4105]
MNFADTIRLQRKNLGLTQRQLASIIEFDVTYLSKLENGRNDYPPSEEIIYKLAECLNLNYNDLLISSGRIKSNAYLLFKILGETYPQFIPFMKRLNQDEKFAKYVFITLGENQNSK